MARKVTDIMDEISEYEASLKRVLEEEGLILVIDLQFYADRMKDLKQELRIAQAIENNQ